MEKYLFYYKDYLVSNSFVYKCELNRLPNNKAYYLKLQKKSKLDLLSNNSHNTTFEEVPEEFDELFDKFGDGKSKRFSTEKEGEENNCKDFASSSSNLMKS